jgi:hypothetical protein
VVLCYIGGIMNKLEEVLSQISEKEAEAAIHPEEVSPNVRQGVEALVRNAKADLEKINTTYRDLVMNSVVTIGVTGETAKEFAEKAESLGAVAVDFNLIKQRLVAALENSGQGEMYNSNMHFRLISELSQIRLDYNMISLPTPIINGYNDGVYDSPIVVAVDRLLDKCYGSALQCAVTRREIGKKALAIRFTGQKLAVVVYNMDRDADTQFIPMPTAQFVSDKEVTDEGVKKKLTEIKSLLNSKTKKPKDQTVTQEE